MKKVNLFLLLIIESVFAHSSTVFNYSACAKIYPPNNFCNAAYDAENSTFTFYDGLGYGAGQWHFKGEVTELKGNSFMYDNCIVSFVIPASVIHIECQFWESSLTRLLFSERDGKDILIEQSVFCKLPYLEYVALPEGLTSISYCCFYNCPKLSSVEFPSTLKSIQQWAFLKDSSLTEIVLPSGLQYINNEAFQGCKLMKITVLASQPPICNGDPFAFDGEYTICESAILYVPYKSIYKYKNADIWCKFTIQAIPGSEDWPSEEDENALSVAVNDSTMGTASIQIVAEPYEGYRFFEWNDGNYDNPRTIPMSEAKKYIAILASNGYAVHANSQDTTMGLVTGGGVYQYYNQVTIEAIPKSGYTFVRWTDGITDNPRSLTIFNDDSYTAVFEESGYVPTKNDQVKQSNRVSSQFFDLQGRPTQPQSQLISVSEKQKVLTR